MTSCEWCRHSENRIFEKGFTGELYQSLGWLLEVISMDVAVPTAVRERENSVARQK